MREFLKQKKTLLSLTAGAILVALAWAEGHLGGFGAIGALIAIATVASKKAGDNRVEDLLSILADATKKAAPLFLAAVLLAGCASAQIHDDVVELRRLHANWRSATVAKPGIDQDRLDGIANKLEKTMADLEELTR